MCRAISSMAILKQSNWSACQYVRSDLGPLSAKYVSALAKCCYSRCRYTRRMLCSSKWRKVLGKMSSYPKFTVTSDSNTHAAVCQTL